MNVYGNEIEKARIHKDVTKAFVKRFKRFQDDSEFAAKVIDLYDSIAVSIIKIKPPKKQSRD